MRLAAGDVKRVLLSKNAVHLFHANSVATACTFLRSGGLLSRGAVEARRLHQTWQPSDATDRSVGVWNDIFMDAVDIGDRVHGRNKYGPVLFKFNLDMLDYVYLPEVWVTKINPMYWTSRNVPVDERYYQTVQQLEDQYTLGDFGAMFTLRNTMDILPFNGHLDGIILDNPNRGNEVLNEATLAMREAMRQGGVIVNMETRNAGTSYCDITNHTFNRLFLL